MRAALLSILLAGALPAEEVTEPPQQAADPGRAALEHMLSERESPEALEKAIAEARKLGVGDQAVLEARFIFHVDRREDAELAALAPEFVRRRDAFRLSDSEIFGVREDWLAVVEYVQAIAALQENDQAAFKKHITEAFWLSPRQGVAFAPHIERLRLDEAMKKVRVDFTRSFRTLGGEELSLASLMDGRKAMLLHFWSPWSRECEASVSDFVATARELEKNGVAVVTVIGEAAPEALADTEEIFSALSQKPPGIWIRDANKASLSQLLRVQNVPLMVLVGPDGRVVFNGHPAEAGLWERLATFAPGIERPRLDDGH